MATVDCIKVNADYESVLFHGRPGPLAVNRALEFLPLYFQNLPVLTTHEYSSTFLEHVQQVSGREPRLTKTGNPLNWWGPLKDLERERWMNSKLTSAELSTKQGWSRTKILSRDEVMNLNITEELLVKDPFGMSGKGIVSLHPDKKVTLPGSMEGQLIVEPLLKRSHDFSHYVFPDGKIICYENIVDERFQYRGTILSPDDLTITSLSFYEHISPDSWKSFQKQLQEIREHYGDESAYGYSIDSFVYEENGEFKIYPLCEVNARRTMGSVAYEFMRLLGKGRKTALTLKSPYFKDFIKLSPEGVLFEIYLSFE